MFTKEIIYEALKNHFGFEAFKDNQEHIISSLLHGKDTFVIMPTGGGKSLCYQLPALMLPGTAIIISPLIALMKNQVDSIRGYGQTDEIAHFLNSSLNRSEIKQVKDDIVRSKTKLLYVAPETLQKEETIEFLNSVDLSFIAVDEAHCISEWGHDFRPDYRRIRDMINSLNRHIPTIALTATATPKVQTDIVKSLEMVDPQIYVSSFNRPNLYYEVRPKITKDQTAKQIVQIIKSHPGESGIIYVQARKTTEDLAQILQVNGIKASPYHAGMEAKARTQVQDDFLMEEIDVICATIAFGMGIDKPDVRFVIHFDIPKSLENYYQETGRAGRDGMVGDCYAFFSNADLLRLEKFLRDKPASERDMGAQLLDEMEAYVESAVCRRKFVLHYFGEEFDKESCKEMCDNCRNPKPLQEAKEEMLLALKAIKSLNQNFTIKTLVEFICGVKTKDILDYDLDQNELFSKGIDKGNLYWFSLFRQGIIMDYIIKDIETYGILKLSEKGQEFIDKPTKVYISINHDYGDTSSFTEEDSAPSQGAALDPVLFKTLKEIRLEVARKNKVKPWVIFFDPALEEMATRFPITIDDLCKISGVSKGKAERYGQPFLDFIQKYVEENDIERAEDFVIRQVADKSKNKVEIIKSIDKKIPLEDIARNLQMNMEELMDELNMIVSSGTRINIDYYIKDNVDEYSKEDIFDYFNSAESDSAEEAYQSLKEDDITFEEIRLIRLKYMSEMVN
ncbi:MAG: RecQ family ATP-dependent DNA helicase [Saprospiraceae bacterium]